MRTRGETTMRHVRVVVLALAALATLVVPAWAATAFLVRSYTATSVTGQAINVCGYQYGGTQFERYFPMMTMYPLSVEVE